MVAEILHVKSFIKHIQFVGADFVWYEGLEPPNSLPQTPLRELMSGERVFGRGNEPQGPTPPATRSGGVLRSNRGMGPGKVRIWCILGLENRIKTV